MEKENEGEEGWREKGMRKEEEDGGWGIRVRECQGEDG